jgi:hypothetical protein
MVVHTILYKASYIVKVHKGVAFHLFANGGGGFFGVIVAGVQDHIARQLAA